MKSFSLDLRSARRAVVVLALAALTILGTVAMAYAGAPRGGDLGGDVVLPVEPDGGIGDTPIVLPVEPDGGIGN